MPNSVNTNQPINRLIPTKPQLAEDPAGNFQERKVTAVADNPLEARVDNSSFGLTPLTRTVGERRINLVSETYRTDYLVPKACSFSKSRVLNGFIKALVQIVKNYLAMRSLRNLLQKFSLQPTILIKNCLAIRIV